MAVSAGRHVPLCFGTRYFRVLFHVKRCTRIITTRNSTGCMRALNWSIWRQTCVPIRTYVSVSSAGDDPVKATVETGKSRDHGHGAEKRMLRLAKKEARRQLSLEKRMEKQLNKVEKKTVTYDISTTPGQKKDVSIPLPITYSPQYVEAAWYDWWQQEGFFTPEATARAGAGRFALCLPPPNVTGTLHLGHALGNSIQDALTRWQRMCGRAVLWVPGTDHAGIATQVVVEKQLAREKGLTRHQVGRQAFIDHVWTWKREKGGVISDQMRRLGSTLDWSREFFTLDPGHSQAVNEAFIRLHDRGLIYRKERLVNWSCALKSTISDIEVDNIPLEKKTYLSVPGYDKKVPFGELTAFAYPVEGSDAEVVVWTTRLETMLGDTGVAVHPDDPRFTHLHGRTLLHPLTGSRLPVVTDQTVHMDYGSGAVKITPAHDQKDYALGLRHSLPLRDVFDDSGCLTNVPEQFSGMPRFHARKVILDILKEKNLYRGSKDNPMVLPQCSRSGDVIEPRLKDQWYVDCGHMSREAVRVVQTGELELIPSMYNAHWNEWLKEARGVNFLNVLHFHCCTKCKNGDWCVSRQLWWGHRIPVYRVVSVTSGQPLPLDTPVWVSAHNENEAREKSAAKLGVSPSDIVLKQDEDVLDTWFSSAIVPFSVMGWPNKTSDLDLYYPTDLLETGSDILFFWVARMVMLGQELTGKLPFNKVLLHSILRDSHGRKMSKSLGNVVDPMDVINGTTLEALQSKLGSSNLTAAEVMKARDGQTKDFPLGIEPCGADALRFTMCSYNYKNQYVNVDVSHMAAHMRFCNKVWQAFRFSAGHWGAHYTPPQQLQLTEVASATDRWILSQMSEMVTKCQQGFVTYSLNHVTAAIYSFWWLRFCDVYVEYSKTVLQEGCPERIAMVKDILHLCVSTGLRTLSPFMPFITEELYQRLPGVDLQKAPSVTLASYPQPEEYPWRNPAVDEGMTQVQAVINQMMSVRKDFNLHRAKPTVVLVAPSDDVARTLSDFRETLTTLSRSECITMETTDPGHLAGCVRLELTDGTILYIKLDGLVDAPEELSRLGARWFKLEGERLSLEGVLKASGEVQSSHLVHMDRLNSITTDLARLEKAMGLLRQLS